MRILRAEHLGMCFGVRDAITMANEMAEVRPLTILGDLVHNEAVLAELRAKGIQFQNDAKEVATESVMVTAHGASERRMNEARERGLKLFEATCPLVHVAHRAVYKLAKDGFHPVIIGKRDHVEVRGLTEDLPEFDPRSHPGVSGLGGAGNPGSAHGWPQCQAGRSGEPACCGTVLVVPQGALPVPAAGEGDRPSGR